MLKIYRVEKNDPLLWQESFSDVDVANLLERRDLAITHDLNRFDVYRQGGIRKAAKNLLNEEAKRTKDEIARGDNIYERPSTASLTHTHMHMNENTHSAGTHPKPDPTTRQRVAKQPLPAPRTKQTLTDKPSGPEPAKDEKSTAVA